MKKRKKKNEIKLRTQMPNLKSLHAFNANEAPMVCAKKNKTMKKEEMKKWRKYQLTAVVFPKSSLM